MALIKAVALGAIAAISVPYVLREESGALGRLVHVWAVHPVPGAFGLWFSMPVFFVVAGVGYVLLKVADQ